MGCGTSVVDDWSPRPAKTRSARVVTFAAEPEHELPPGWTVEKSRSTGEMYYHNTETGESSWGKPKLLGKTGDIEPTPRGESIAIRCTDTLTLFPLLPSRPLSAQLPPEP